jgi:hypothetical protein
MAEIITEPNTTHVVHEDSGGNSGSWAALIGLALLIVIALLFFYFALPMLNRATTTPQVNVPDKVDVNVNKTQ